MGLADKETAVRPSSMLELKHPMLMQYKMQPSLNASSLDLAPYDILFKPDVISAQVAVFMTAHPEQEAIYRGEKEKIWPTKG
ncbi:MAG: hypothetical protein DRI46_10790 [Chloroflexi bacterium]|nr:MAG: hypothetical protein DRI46_10790 [Chloroflexota bacterium]